MHFCGWVLLGSLLRVALSQKNVIMGTTRCWASVIVYNQLNVEKSVDNRDVKFYINIYLKIIILYLPSTFFMN